ncbi:MAG: Fe-S cluster assembly protein SufD, partial [Chitinophagaceae bacterium]|nr:Fe-S cluster assembly protein SufD [Chitinophagaceae bacterium]
MTTTTSLYDQFITLYKDKESQREDNWLRSLREKAFESFSHTGFPTVKMEEWRYTNVSPFLKEDFRLQPGEATLFNQRGRIQIPSLDAHEVVLKNGML